jgi:hypothetical protein
MSEPTGEPYFLSFDSVPVEKMNRNGENRFGFATYSLKKAARNV